MIRAFQWDLARQVERLDWLLAQLPRYAAWGYQELYLHLEDAVHYPSLPGVARADAYTYRELGTLVEAAGRAGIKVVPIVNLLGHTQYLIKVPALRDLNELRAPDGAPLPRGQICPSHPRTIEVAEKLLRDIAPFCTAGKVHVGLDESFHLGRHPLSRREIARIGRAAHFSRYVGRLHALTSGLGLRLGMWADMLYFLPEAIRTLPRGIIAYDWYYYPFRRHPRVELFNFAERDLAPALRARGIEYWGCPMNGVFRHEPLPIFGERLANIQSWWNRCRRQGAGGFLITSWEPQRIANELTTVVDAAAAGLWLEPAATKPEVMLARGFERVFGRAGSRSAAQVALACDRHPFAGYPRWEINERWDTVSRRESLVPYRREEQSFAALAGRAIREKLPAALRASVTFRLYLARRDLFVRIAARGQAGKKEAARFMRDLRVGQQALQTMWRLTRDQRGAGPNEEILRRDSAQLRVWRRRADPSGPSWQICYAVKNFAPASQLVAVEQRMRDGRWKRLQSCYTIEFQAKAARPRGEVVREHAALVKLGGLASFPLRLRFAVSGVGQVKIGRVILTDGRSWLHAAVPGRGQWLRLGTPAPKAGWPIIPAGPAQDILEIIFSPTRPDPRSRRLQTKK